MSDVELLKEVRQMRKLLELIAEPAIAQRDAKLREDLRSAVGNGARKQKSIFLMDGTRTQTQIANQVPVDQGDLSKLLARLESSDLLVDGRKQPKLAISIPVSFFDADTNAKRR
ncbi:MAG: hypothetical protein IPL75_03190 [Acidobacteria bacterium]|nr:hypothetical protein [Acidobacteriota bacterium]